MARHLKTDIISRFKGAISYFVPNSDVSATHARGVRYFVPVDGINCFCGSMNTEKEGRKYKKHIVVRQYPHHRAVLQLYTYHFPTHWSAACVANRELIKEAQRQAHALERAHTREALEWRTRFLHHYFRVIRCGEKPEPGLKRYSRFYQYTYVVIYRELQAAQQRALQTAEEVSFDPVVPAPVRLTHSRSRFPLENTFTHQIPTHEIAYINEKPYFYSDYFIEPNKTP